MSHLGLKTRGWIAVMASAVLLGACGGGSGDGDYDERGGISLGSDTIITSVITPVIAPIVSTAVSIVNTTPLAVAGMVSGLGSVVVNGVRYETIGANVFDSDDKHAINSPIGIGMVVSLEPNMSNTSSASLIQVQRGIKGPTANVNAALNTFTVAGLPVTADNTTLIMRANGTVGNFADLNFKTVEVYGLPQTDGNFKATRIEVELNPSLVQLAGTISQLNTSNATFKLGSGNNLVTVSYGISTPATGLADGVVVSVHTNTFASSTQYTATQIYLKAANASVFTNYVSNYTGTSGVRNETNELYGMVSGLTRLTQGCTLQVQGLMVKVASTTLCNSIQNGDYVEVKGLLTNGSFAAYRIEFRTTGGDRDLNGYRDDENDNDHDDLKYSRLISTNTSNGVSTPIYSHESSSSYEIYGTLNSCTGSSCILLSNGVPITIDLSNAIWEHGYVVITGAVEAKGYMITNNIFKVTKIESKNRD